jgi:surface antigen
MQQYVPRALRGGTMLRTGRIALAGALMLAACQDVPGMQTKQQAGGLLGGAAGAIAGGLLGERYGVAGSLIGGVLGSVGGYMLGSMIGARLDEGDRQRAAAATAQALAAPAPDTPIAWHSDHNSGIGGTAEVVGQQPMANGGQCRDVREVAYINGEQTTQTSRYCRDANGAWAKQT